MEKFIPNFNLCKSLSSISHGKRYPSFPDLLFPSDRTILHIVGPYFFDIECNVVLKKCKDMYNAYSYSDKHEGEVIMQQPHWSVTLSTGKVTSSANATNKNALYNAWLNNDEYLLSHYVWTITNLYVIIKPIRFSVDGEPYYKFVIDGNPVVKRISLWLPDVIKERVAKST